jgi:hypothetical protein
MKKFIFSLLLFAIIAGTAFFFGYIPFFLDSGELGVVYTKTDGWDNPVIIPGDFRWMWQGLLPTNLRLYRLSPEAHEVYLNLDGLLPSGDVYAAYAGGGEDFSYALKGNIRYTIRPALLPSLFAESGFGENEDSDNPAELLVPLYERLDEELLQLARGTAEELIARGDFGLTSLAFRSLLASRIADDLDEIEAQELLIEEYRFPDMELYRAARENYLGFQRRSHEIQLVELEEAAGAKNREMGRIEILKEYGALLNEYPILLEYYSMRDEDISLIPLSTGE